MGQDTSSDGSSLPDNIDAFISYSRRNTDFIERLFDAIADSGKQPWYDRVKQPLVGIPYGSKWWDEIKRGIEEADNFLFVISPNSINSKYCHAEIHHAIKSNKRAIPILLVCPDKQQNNENLNTRLRVIDQTIEAVSDSERIPDSVDPKGYLFKSLAQQNWDWIKQWDIIDFSDDASYQSNLEELIRVLNSNAELIHQHNNINNRAASWRSGRGGLLTGQELDNAEKWRDVYTGKSIEPPPTTSLLEYITESRRISERNNRRRTASISVALGMMIVLTIVAFSLYRQSEANLSLAEINAALAVDNEATAIANAETATVAQGQAEARTTEVAAQAATSVANLFDAWESQSLFLADLSHQEFDASKPQTALLLALESLTHYYEGIVSVESTSALRQALGTSTHEIALFQHQDNVNGAAYDPEYQRVLTWSRDGTARIWDAESGGNYSSIQASVPITGSIWKSDGSQVLSWGDTAAAAVWNPENGEILFLLPHDEEDDDPRQPNNTACNNRGGMSQTAVSVGRGFRVNDASWSPNEVYVATAGDDSLVKIWDANTGDLIWSFLVGDVWAYPNNILWSPDSRYVIIDPINGSTQLWDVQEGNFVTSIGLSRPIAWNQHGTEFLSYYSHVDMTRMGYIDLWRINGDECLTNNQIEIAEPNEVFSAEDNLNVIAAEYNRDEVTITAALTNNSVRVYDIATGEILKRFPTENMIRGFLWDHDEEWLLTWSVTDFGGNVPGSISLWDASTETVIWRLAVEREVQTAQFSGDNSQIIIGTVGGEFRVLDRHTGQTLYTLQHDDAVQDLDDIISIGANWNQDETQLLTWTDDNTARIWSLRIENPAIDVFVHGSTVDHAYVSPNQQWLLTLGKSMDCATEDCPDLLRIWDIDTQNLEFELSSEAWRELLSYTTASAITFIDALWHENSNEIIVWGDGDLIQLIEVPSGRLKQTFQSPRGFANDHLMQVQFTPDHEGIFAYSSDYEFDIWDIQTGQLRHEISVENDAHIVDIAVNSDSTQLLGWTGGYHSTAAEDYIDIWDIQSGDRILRIRETGGVMGARWNGNYTQILSWTSDIRGCQNCEYSLRLWNARTGEMLWEQIENLEIWGAQWNRDYTHIISWRGNIVNILDATTGDILLRVQHDDWTSGALWNRDESHFATWSEDGTARIWNGESGELDFLLSHPADTRVWGAEWSDDETHIYTYASSIWFCETNCTFSIFIWDASTGQLIQEIAHNDNIANWSVLSDDFLFTASEDGKAHIWLINLTTLIQLGHEQATRELTNTERIRFFLPTQTAIPSPTIEPMGRIHSGHHRGEVPIGNGQIWEYLGEAGEVLSLQVNADIPASTNAEATRIPNGLDTLIIVRDSNGNVIAENDDIESGIITNSFIDNLTLPNDGIYEIEVRSWDDRSGGAYTLIVAVQ